MGQEILLIAVLAAIVFMSIVAFILYGVDKNKAKRGVWRIPEAVLLGWGFFGGAVGALCAMKAFRHKTKHWYFWAVNILGLILHIAIIAAILILL
ncbi:MAG: DUF1294 domain-containing protein [Clostridia bacterium]|nr:DUF1294 domain-containing protein [Clostridia bacterium]